MSDEDFDALVGELLDLVRAGRLLRPPEEGWTLPESTPYRAGIFRQARRGGGLVRLAGSKSRAEDIRVRSGSTGGAFHGDLVLVHLDRGRGKRRPRTRGAERSREEPELEGRIVDVLERSRRMVRGRLFATRGGGVVRPQGGASGQEIFVPTESMGDAHDGEGVLVRLVEGAGKGGQPRGKVVLRRRDEGTLEGDLRVIRELYDLPDAYPPAVVDAVSSAEEMRDGRRWPDRVDLRSLQVFTVDPVDSQDFDDAISLEKAGGGRVRLGVHIADVSHYVREGSEIDREAERRGTSVYLPGHVIHMLPPRLSQNLSSLRPQEDRLTKSVFMTFDPSGQMESFDLCRSVIRSCRRFTYDEVLAILQWIESSVATPSLPPDHVEFEPVLRAMARLRDRLHRRRKRRGALDLEIPRASLRLDAAGHVVGLAMEARDAAHELIEEFMLAANEAVALYCTERGIPLLGRAHSPPEEDKLEDFRVFLKAIGKRLPAKVDAAELQKVVEGVRGDPISGVVQLLLLRTMQHAAYGVGAELHFALATDHYCHFTSPIRRYPDLIVHQILDDHLDGRVRPRGRGGGRERLRFWEARLPGLADAASELERRAEEAEREMTKLRLIRYLAGLVGQHMEGVIVSVHPFGFFVQAEDPWIDGMVPIATLGDDYYEVDPSGFALVGSREGRRFRVGDRVSLELSNVDPDFREITFRVLGSGSDDGRRKGGRQGRRQGTRKRR